MKLNCLPFTFPSVIGLDIETYGSGGFPDPYRDKVALIQIDIPGDDTYVLTEDFQRVIPLLLDPSMTKLIHNVSFDSKFLLHHLGVRLENVFDTMLAERILTAGRQRSASLKAVAQRRLGVELDKDVRTKFVQSYELSQDMLEYAAQDVKVLYPIYQQQVKELKREGLTFVADLENKLALVVGRMELNGIGFDQNQWNIVLKEEQQLRDEAYEQTVKLLQVAFYQNDLFGGTSCEVNLNSRESVLGLLRKQGIDLPNYQAETLEYYLRDHPDCEVIRYILEYKEHEKRLSWNYPQYINPVTNRIHPNIIQIGARTGRFAFRDPNLQQVPKLESFRKMFVADDGYLITADYSQIELRVLAEITNDKNMIEAFNRGDDFHQATAELIATELGGKPDRAQGKGCNFAAVYGSSTRSQALATGMSVRAWNKIYKAYFSTYSALEPWYEKSFSSLIRNGYTTTISGRKRWFPELDPSDPGKYRNISRNTPIQGSALDVMKLALVNVDKALEEYDAKLVHTVHDELVVEVIENEVNEVKNRIEQAMIQAGQYFLKKVPIIVDISISKSWGGKNGI